MSDFKSARRVDELGRVVIPKEIRRASRLCGGDLVKVFIENEKVCIEKYSPIKSLNTFANDFVTSLYRTTGKYVMITDTTEVLKTIRSQHDYEGKKLTNGYVDLIKEGKSVLCNAVDGAEIIKPFEDFNGITAEYILPVHSEGLVIGSVIVYDEDKGVEIDRSVIVATNFGVKFLERQFEVNND